MMGGTMTLAPSTIFANGTDLTCPLEWKDYVIAVREIVDRADFIDPIVFVSREGETFDCMKTVHDDNFLDVISKYNQNTPHDGSKIELLASENWPPNLCNVSRVNLSNIPLFYSVELPRQIDILELPICRIRVENALGYFIGINK